MDIENTVFEWSKMVCSTCREARSETNKVRNSLEKDRSSGMKDKTC